MPDRSPLRSDSLRNPVCQERVRRIVTGSHPAPSRRRGDSIWKSHVMIRSRPMAAWLVAGAVLPALLCSGCGKSAEGTPSAPPPVSVDIGTPTDKQVTDYRDFTGRLEPVADVEIRARVSGYLKKIEFAVDDVVWDRRRRLHGHRRNGRRCRRHGDADHLGQGGHTRRRRRAVFSHGSTGAASAAARVAGSRASAAGRPADRLRRRRRSR